ncbi:hypothetical protein F8M41_011400 [Gigaspora margarita]|uniref:Uncharacterized protein n=1 Tax=Gigaspora margarita TaxID=4874 RepID=A0A8H3X2E9_GIGMA|nr:hypothetical protein F8M41_011400 [Gigaspora margarita]
MNFIIHEIKPKSNDSMLFVHFVFATLSFVSCLEIFWLIFELKYVKNKSLGVDVKLCFYLTITHFLYSVSQMINLFSVRIDALTEPSLSCDIGGELSPTFLTMNLLVIVIFAFDTIWKNFLRTDSQRFRNFILWGTLFLVSWIASTLGLNRYIPLELWCARRLYMPFTDYMNFGIIITGIISAISLYFQLVNPMKSQDITCSHEKTFISTLFFVYTFQWLCFLFSNILIILNLENYSVTYQTFFYVILLIGSHSGGILNSILLSIKQHCDIDLDDEINNIEKNNNPTTLKNINYSNSDNNDNENEKDNDNNSTKLVFTSTKTYGTMHK